MLVKKILFTTLLTLCFVGFSSCSSDDKNDDTTGPVITLSEPADGESFARGEEIHVELDLEDESGIKEYKIDIHWGEGHDHKSAVARDASVTEDVPWTYQKVYDDKKGQKKAHVHIHTDHIPKETDPARLGKYHFGILATDMVGNESRKYISINIVE